MKNTRLFAVATSLFITLASLHAQTNVLLNGTSGTNVIATSYSNASGVNLSLGFFADYLVVGGGGGGGGVLSANAGGGGGAQVVAGNNTNFTTQNYAITVGTGGAGGIGTSNSAATVGGVGGLSSLMGTNLNVTAQGGGGGAGSLGNQGSGVVVANATTNGASGGGGSSQSDTSRLGAPGPGTAGQGNAGGAAVAAYPNAQDQAGGGGGGAGAAGGAGSSSSGGAGGNGTSNSITGSSVFYGGGGGGGKRVGGSGGSGGQGGGGAGGLNASGAAGTANTGGGGGGAGATVSSGAGGAGGSGVVIVRYLGSSVGNVGGTVTSGTGTAAGYTLHTFTSTGSNSFNLSGVDMNSRLGATITGDITGGNIKANGPGTITLAGSNRATQDGAVNAGTLRLTGTLLNQRGYVSQTAGISAMIVDGGNWAGTSSDGLMDSLSVGTLAGANGSLTLNSGSVTTRSMYVGQANVAATNAGTGVVTVNGGTLDTRALDIGMLGSGTLNVTGGSVVMTNGNAIGTIDLARFTNGTATVNVTGGTLSAKNVQMSFNGAQVGGRSQLNISNGGTVQISSLFSMGGSVQGAASNAVVNLGPGGTLRIGISGIPTGGRLVAGPSGFDVLGTLEFLGGSSVMQGGPLRIGNGGTNGVLIGNLTTTSSVTFNRAGELTYAGNLRGSAPLIKEGSGTLTLLGTNTYNGAIRLNAGTLIGNATSIGGVGISNNGTVVFNQTNAGFGTGSISGSGNLIKNGDGRLHLNGSNSYAGGTLVNAGTLAGHTTSLQGAITNNATVEFQQLNDGVYAGTMVGTGGLLKTGAAALTLSGANTYSGGTVVSAGTLQGNTTSLQGAISNAAWVFFNQSTDGTYAGALSGAGELRKLGNAVLTLTGENTQGSTLIGAGSLQIGNGGATGSLAGAITNNGTLTFNRAGSLVSSGSISGTGNLNKEGTGTVTLTGSNSFKGDTVVNNGRLVLGGSNSLGRASVVKVNTNGTVEATQRVVIGYLDLNGGNVIGNTNLVSSLTLINSGTVSGLADGVDFAAGILKRTSGTAIVDGANTFTGTIKVEAGTMRMTNGGSFAAGSSLYLYSGATMDLNGVSQTFSALDGAAGSVTLGAGNLTVSGAETSDFGGVISGSGRLVKGGSGVMTLTGANTYTGGTEVTGGRLVGDTTSLRGAISNNATVEFNVESDAAFGASIAGSGTVVKSGAGVLSVTNAQSYTGATTVTGGGLNVDGSMDGSIVTVETGAALSGSGSVGGIVLNLGSTISPGNSPGTFTVTGNAVFNPGANYNWQIHDAAPGGAGSPTGWDLISATGQLDLSALTVGSEFNINLWSLQQVAPDFSGDAINFDPSQSYTWTILTAAGGILGYTGTEQFNINLGANNGTAGFANLLNDGAFSVVQSGNNLNLVFTAAGSQAVPEPGTWVTAALLAGGAAFMRWRKRKRH